MEDFVASSLVVEEEALHPFKKNHPNPVLPMIGTDSEVKTLAESPALPITAQHFH